MKKRDTTVIIVLACVALFLFSGDAMASIITSSGPRKPKVSTSDGGVGTWAAKRYKLAHD